MWEREYHNEGNIETGKLCKITLIIFLISTMMIIKLIILITILSFNIMRVIMMNVLVTDIMFIFTSSNPNTT